MENDAWVLFGKKAIEWLRESRSDLFSPIEGLVVAPNEVDGEEGFDPATLSQAIEAADEDGLLVTYTLTAEEKAGALDHFCREGVEAHIEHEEDNGRPWNLSAIDWDELTNDMFPQYMQEIQEAVKEEYWEQWHDRG